MTTTQTQAGDMEIVGRAVYLEFTKMGATAQYLLLPEGMSTSHKVVPMALYRRKLTKVHPRKTWNVSASPSTAASIRARLGGSATSASIAEEMLKLIITPVIAQLQLNNWKLYKDPIVVDVTMEDLEMVRNAKTPYKVLGRVNKTRKALGFPKELVHPIDPVLA